MKIVTWNIRIGGSKSSFDVIINYLNEHHSDIIILTEFYNNEKREAIKKGLFASGYVWQNVISGFQGGDSILIASKLYFEDVTDSSDYHIPSERWVEIHLTEEDIYILAAYIPSYLTRQHDRDVFWSELLSYAEKNKDKRTVIIGDYNVSFLDENQGPPASCFENLASLNKLGWTDSWRYTHKGRTQSDWNNPDEDGFRIDHAFVSPPLAEHLVNCSFSHEGNLLQLSSHSVLAVEIDL